MKQFLPFFLSFMALSCVQKSPDNIESTVHEDAFDLSLLRGKWERMNNDADQKTYEFWESGKNAFHGLGFTLVGEDTVFKEILAIVDQSGDLFYDVRGVNPEPTLFKFSKQSLSTFVCVNDSNDFPKRIEYHLYKDSMTAIISDDDQRVSFEFRRIE